MSYDDRGNWQYDDHEADVFRPRCAQRIAAALRQIGYWMALLLVLGALVGGGAVIVYGSWYAVGRAVGAGARDGRR